ncbi:hypothetical protein H6A03_01165 [[Clostridium] spiroforme]|nr:hypothetical protein [Thomasclavelia spiroformis]
MSKKIKRFDETKEKIYVGQVSNGWTMIKEYHNHNLWINRIGVRESFFKNQLPNNKSILSED